VLRRTRFMMLIAAQGRRQGRDAGILSERASLSCSLFVANCYANVRPVILSVMNPAPLCVRPHTLYKGATDSARHAA
jgi:hypothetical protein